MRPGRTIVVLWSVVLLALVLLELAELTHLFTFPIASVLADPVTIVVSLVFVTIVAIVGAIFVGIYISTRVLRPRGFTPFEEEMLRMREDLTELRQAVDRLGAARDPGPPELAPRGPNRR